MNKQTYQAYTDSLQANLDADNRVIGLVALGSMADLSRQDEWSDHDFFVIVQDGVAETFRTDLSWLPDAEQIVMQFRETDHGLKVLYKNTHLIEFAVFTREELNLARVNDYTVLVDKADIESALQHLRTISEPAVHDDDYYHRNLLHMLSLLQVGAGRYVRGERMSGHIFIKSHALNHLLPILEHYLESDNKHKLDNLDPFRRVSFVYPHLGERLHQAMLKPPPQTAADYLDICDDYLGQLMPNYPTETVVTIRAFLHKTTL